VTANGRNKVRRAINGVRRGREEVEQLRGNAVGPSQCVCASPDRPLAIGCDRACGALSHHEATPMARTLNHPPNSL